MNILVVVPRIDRGRTSTVAIVKATTTDMFLDETLFSTPAGALQGAISSAVTEWINETAEGKDAYEESCGSFNIGDLALHQDDETLGKYLKEYGIELLSVEVEDGMDSQWEFDETLVNDIDLNYVLER